MIKVPTRIRRMISQWITTSFTSYIYIIGLILQHFEGHGQIILYVSLNRVQAALHNRDEWKKSYKI